MKNPLIAFVVLLVLAGCSTAGEQERDQPAIASTESGGSEEVRNERTIDLMGEDPFEIGVNKVIIGKWIDDGETVYILDDGKLLEDKIASALKEHEEKFRKMEEEYGVKLQKPELETFEEKIAVFAKNILRDHPDKEEYIDKLKEANEALKKEDEKLVKQKIEEARKLRTQ